MGFGEDDHKGKVSIWTPHIKGASCYHDFLLMLIIWLKVLFVRFLHCSHSFLFCIPYSLEEIYCVSSYFREYKVILPSP